MSTNEPNEPKVIGHVTTVDIAPHFPGDVYPVQAVGQVNNETFFVTTHVYRHREFGPEYLMIHETLVSRYEPVEGDSSNED